MYTHCIVCGNTNLQELTLNDLPMRQCPSDGLTWRASFDIATPHYTTKHVDFEDGRIEERWINSRQRMKTLQQHADLNNFCDIGTGEGLFVEALQAAGYKNVIGIEPNSECVRYAEEKHLPVFTGTISDISTIAKDRGIHTYGMFHVIEHLTNPREDMKRLYDQMVAGDTLIIETPNFLGYAMQKRQYRHKLVYEEHLFYFNQKNIKQLLTGVGFTFVAEGKRDFNDRYFSFKESLMRLGLRTPQPERRLLLEKANIDEAITSTHTVHPHIQSWYMPKQIIKYLLSMPVRWLGRVDFMWIIVRK